MGKGKTTESKPEVVPKPPDGGWGWFVVLGSFLLHVIADGIVYSFGVFYVEFLDYFGGGKGETSWIGSLVPGVTLGVGKSQNQFKFVLWLKLLSSKLFLKKYFIKLK